MRLETKLIIWVVLTATLFWFIGYWISPNDIDTKEVLEQERIKVEETLSWLNLQLSGYSSWRWYREWIKAQARTNQIELEEKANVVKYRKRIYENKKAWLEMLIGTGEVKKEVKKTQAINLLPTVKAENIKWKISIKWFPEDSMANLIANKVYQEVGLDMVLTLIGENGTFKIDRKSMIIGSNWYSDYWLCQLNYQYHKKFIDSPDFQNREKQVEYCEGVRNDAVKKWRLETTFYAFNHRLKYQDRIIYK